MPTRGKGSGVVSAVDVASGRIRWKAALPYPAQGGALITASGLVFTSDLGGTLYAFDIATGRELWKIDTGSSIVAPLSTFALGGEQYVSILVGEPGIEKTQTFRRRTAVAFWLTNSVPPDGSQRR